MKTLKFTQDLVTLVLSGEKNTTWRLFDDKNLSTGDDLELINKETNEVFGSAKILQVLEKKLGDVSDQDYDGHEKFPDQKTMIETYKKYYGNDVNEDTLVKIIKFSLNKR